MPFWEMSKQEKEEGREVVEKLMDLWSPLDLERGLYFHLPPSPQSPGLCLSPLWNFYEDNNRDLTGEINVMTSTNNGLPRIDFPRSPGDPLISKRLAANHDTLDQSPSLHCLKYRIMQAFKYIKESTTQRVLAQVWAPVKMGTQYLLATSGQPFILSVENHGLAQYRLISLMYAFPADPVDDDLGLPGRVFRSKLPEWTPNAQYYSTKEYPQLNHAIHYDIRGILALPLFYSGDCIGVLELIMTSQKINYAPEFDLVCKALERWLPFCENEIHENYEGKRTKKGATGIVLNTNFNESEFIKERNCELNHGILESVNLKSSNVFDLPRTHVVDKNERNRLEEILELMTAVCETYKLPLAQTWIPTGIRQVVSCGQSLHASSSFEERLMKEACLSTSDLSFYVVDAHKWGFRDASSEHHLLEGQGVVGRAYLSLKSCFCEDITLFQKIEYPLVHYARMFGLRSCFAIPICDNQTGKEIYILEFFLPPTLADFRYLQKVLDFLSATINQSSPNLRMAHEEFKEGTIELIHFHVDMKPASGPEYFQRQKTIRPSKYERKNSPTFETIRCMYAADVNSCKQPGNQEVDVIYSKTKIAEGEKILPFTISKKEDKWSLEVLEQLFGMSIQDAADCIGVSRSTMKRKCRKLGIYRWPSYKRKMAGRFSHKQTRKNELLQGSDGAIFCYSQNLYPDSARAWPEQTQRAKKQKSQCSGELPSIVETHLENIASNVDAPTPKLSNGAAIQGERTAFIKIKATYGEYNIRFTLHYPSAFVDLETEVQKRLKLMLGTFTLKYLDADSDWILIACDEDLEDILEVFFSKGIIKMLVEDINHL